MRNPDHIPATFAGQMNSLAIFGASNYIFVPPKVQLVLVRPDSLSLPKNHGFLCIKYPVPQQWPHVIKNPGLHLVDLVDEEFINSDKALSDQFTSNFTKEVFINGEDVFYSPVDEGWKVVEEFDGLNDFLKLADEKLDLSGAEKVKKFVEHWGPLWICQTRSHHTKDIITGSPLGFCYGLRYTQPAWGGEPCLWRPLEEVEVFIQEAKRAKSVLEAASELANDRLIPAHIRKSPLIPPVDESSPPYSIQQDRLSLYVFLRDILTHYGDLYIKPKVSKEDFSLTKVELKYNDGFIHAVWIQISQLLCRMRGFSQCSHCGRYYLREMRREKEGQDNYCTECGPEKKYRHSKKNTWTKNKDKYNSRRLYKNGFSIKEISHKLNIDQKTIKEWISTSSKDDIK